MSRDNALLIAGHNVFFPDGRKPFPAQMGLMNAILRAATNSHNGLLESPTGTGKTLALLCAALAFQRKKRIEHFVAQTLANAWGAQQSAAIANAWGAARANAAAAAAGAGDGSGVAFKRERRRGAGAAGADVAAEDGFSAAAELGITGPGVPLPGRSGGGPAPPAPLQVHPVIAARLGAWSAAVDARRGALKKVVEEPPKVFFTSRTHSQLAQAVNELRKCGGYMHDNESVRLLPDPLPPWAVDAIVPGSLRRHAPSAAMTVLEGLPPLPAAPPSVVPPVPGLAAELETPTPTLPASAAPPPAAPRWHLLPQSAAASPLAQVAALIDRLYEAQMPADTAAAAQAAGAVASAAGGGAGRAATGAPGAPIAAHSAAAGGGATAGGGSAGASKPSPVAPASAAPAGGGADVKPVISGGPAAAAARASLLPPHLRPKPAASQTAAAPVPPVLPAGGFSLPTTVVATSMPLPASQAASSHVAAASEGSIVRVLLFDSAGLILPGELQCVLKPPQMTTLASRTQTCVNSTVVGNKHASKVDPSQSAAGAASVDIDALSAAWRELERRNASAAASVARVAFPAGGGGAAPATAAPSMAAGAAVGGVDAMVSLTPSTSPPSTAFSQSSSASAAAGGSAGASALMSVHHEGRVRRAMELLRTDLEALEESSARDAAAISSGTYRGLYSRGGRRGGGGSSGGGRGGRAGGTGAAASAPAVAGGEGAAPRSVDEMCRDMFTPGGGCSCRHNTGTNALVARLPRVWDIEDSIRLALAPKASGASRPPAARGSASAEYDDDGGSGGTAGAFSHMMIAGGCPFFASREMFSTASVIFAPYSYLLDPVFRNTMRIDLNNAVVVIDEGHNVEDACRDAASCEFQREDLTELLLGLSIMVSRGHLLHAHRPLKAVVEKLLLWFDAACDRLGVPPPDGSFAGGGVAAFRSMSVGMALAAIGYEDGAGAASGAAAGASHYDGFGGGFAGGAAGGGGSSRSLYNPASGPLPPVAAAAPPGTGTNTAAVTGSGSRYGAATGGGFFADSGGGGGGARGGGPGGGGGSGAGGPIEHIWDGQEAIKLLASVGVSLPTFASLYEAYLEAAEYKNAASKSGGGPGGGGGGGGGVGGLHAAIEAAGAGMPEISNKGMKTLEKLLTVAGFLLMPRGGAAALGAPPTAAGAAGAAAGAPGRVTRPTAIAPAANSADDFHLAIQIDRPPAAGATGWSGGRSQYGGGAGAASSQQQLARKLCLWCMSPALAFSEVSAMARSVIITSGTLAPLDSFASELGVPFPVRLEASHVINVARQLWVGVIGSSPLPGSVSLVHCADDPVARPLLTDAAVPPASAAVGTGATAQLASTAAPAAAVAPAGAPAPSGWTWHTTDRSWAERDLAHMRHASAAVPRALAIGGVAGPPVPSVSAATIPLLTSGGGASLSGVYSNANTDAYLDAVGVALLALSCRTPGGVLAFVSSYRLLDKLVTRWKSPQCCVNVSVRTRRPGAEEAYDWTDVKLPLFSALQCVKTVFTEPKEAGEDFGDMLASFRRVNEAAKVSQLERVRLGSQARAPPPAAPQAAAPGRASSTPADTHIDIAGSGEDTELDDDGAAEDAMGGGGKRARMDAEMPALVAAATGASASSQRAALGSFDYGDDDSSDGDIAMASKANAAAAGSAAAAGAADVEAASGCFSPFSISIAKRSSTPSSSTAAAASAAAKPAASARGGKRGTRKPRDPSKSKRKRWTDADRARAITKYEHQMARLDAGDDCITDDDDGAAASSGVRSGAAGDTRSAAVVAAAADDAQRDVFNSQPLASGGLMIAVARGKASEGLDFSDHHARCVVVIGIPYANVSESLVALKRAYQDKQVKRATAAGAVAGGSAGPGGIPMPITGAQWYKQQAFRALNQALGRCIRHRHDYGSIILLDPRFESEVESLSKWARPAVRTGVLLPTAIREMQRFFGELLASPPGTT